MLHDSLWLSKKVEDLFFGDVRVAIFIWGWGCLSGDGVGTWMGDTSTARERRKGGTDMMGGKFVMFF